MDLWDLLPSPAAASGAPTLYLLGNWPFSVALALRVRPRAGRARVTGDPSSCWFYVLNTTGLQWPTCSRDLHRSKSKAHPSRLSVSHAWGALPCKERRRCFSVCFLLALCNQNSTKASIRPSDKRGPASNLGKVYSSHNVFFLPSILLSACLGLYPENSQKREAARNRR